MFKKIFKLDNILSFILSIYLFINIICVYNLDVTSIVLYPFLFSFLFIMFKIIINLLDKVNLSSNGNITRKEMIIYGLIILLSLSFIIMANPASESNSSPDIINQFNQAINNDYSDWHPLMHTLIFYKLPTLIHQSLFTCGLFQGLFIGLILLYFSYFARKYFLNYKGTIIILLLFLFNPINIRMTTLLWKDIPFSYSMMLLTMNLVEIVLTNGEWLSKNKNKILFILGSFGIIFFRHNGIASYLIMMTLLIFLINKKKFLTLSMLAFIIMYLSTSPIYSHFNIAKNGGIGECLGVPLNQISYIFNNNGVVNDDELNVMNNIASLKYWKENYRVNSFNEIKWYSNYDAYYVNKNYKKILNIWLNMVKDNPKLAIESYKEVTLPIWGIYSYLNFDVANTTYATLSGDAIADYSKIIENTVFRFVVIDIADGLFLTILAFVLIIKKYKLDLKAYIPFSLTLSNTLVIMCLITGGEIRFVYAQILCAYPLLLYSLKKNNNNYKLKDNTFIQFIKYFFVGLIAAFVNIGFLYIFTDILHINYIISNILAFTLGLITNYLLSKKYVFVNENIDNKKIEFMIYALIGITGLIIDTFILFILVDKFKIYYMISKVISTLLVFIWNFSVRKLFYKVLGGKI